MSFNWNHYNDLANDLINQKRTSGIEEACYRSSISRSYYSVFNIIRNFLENNGHTIPNRQAHSKVIEILKKDSSYKPIGVKLERLRDQRNIADYNANASINHSYAISWYKETQKIFMDLKNTKII